jgi:hypothetical protein
MNNALKQRTVEREGFSWALETQEVKGHQPYSRRVQIKRNGELWAAVLLKHVGGTKTIPVFPSHKVPSSVMDEVKKELGV